MEIRKLNSCQPLPFDGLLVFAVLFIWSKRIKKYTTLQEVLMPEITTHVFCYYDSQCSIYSDIISGQLCWFPVNTMEIEFLQ